MLDMYVPTFTFYSILANNFHLILYLTSVILYTPFFMLQLLLDFLMIYLFPRLPYNTHRGLMKESKCGYGNTKAKTASMTYLWMLVSTYLSTAD